MALNICRKMRWGKRAHTSAPSLTTFESRVGIYILVSAPPLSHHAELFGAMLGVTFDPEMTKWRSFQDVGDEARPRPQNVIESNLIQYAMSDGLKIDKHHTAFRFRFRFVDPLSHWLMRAIPGFSTRC